MCANRVPCFFKIEASPYYYENRIIMKLIIIIPLMTSAFLVFLSIRFGEDGLSKTFLSVIGGVIGLFGGSGLLVFSFFLFGEKEMVTRRHRLFSLTDNTQTEGNFVLGTGTIENKFYYYTYYAHKDGGYFRGRIPGKDVRIMEWDENYAVHEFRVETAVNESLWGKMDSRQEGTIIRVPEGALIKNNYILDSQ